MDYNEFLRLINDKVNELLAHEPSEKVGKFLSEQEYWIREEYEMAMTDLRSGKLTEQELKIGWVAKVANCLYYMF